jgi:hypothetical protein
MPELLRALRAKFSRDGIGALAILMHDKIMGDPAFEHEVGIDAIRQILVPYQVAAVTNELNSPHYKPLDPGGDFSSGPQISIAAERRLEASGVATVVTRIPSRYAESGHGACQHA